ncbi:hypothetical protein [Salininema proteolyticum]|uniref:Uncharacterized protein n=1 Tax=Salininema proteolyticum TaxID=1607685 RepID=A0ABV8TUG8_9ACTN
MRPTIIDHPDDVLKWLREGHTYPEIGRKYQAAHGVYLSPQVIQGFAAGKGLLRRTKVEWTVPFKVEEKHKGKIETRLLQAYLRRKAGLPVSGVRPERLDRWLEWLEKENRVVAYDRDEKEPYSYPERREGIDTDVWREPDHW